MRIASYRRFAESISQYNVCRFSAHALKLQKLFHCVGDFAAELLNYPCTGAINTDCFIVIKAGGFYIRLNLFYISSCPIRSRFIFPEQIRGYHIDPHVRALCRENRCYEKFQRIFEAERGFCLRVYFVQYRPNLLDPFGRLGLAHLNPGFFNFCFFWHSCYSEESFFKCSFSFLAKNIPFNLTGCSSPGIYNILTGTPGSSYLFFKAIVAG